MWGISWGCQVSVDFLNESNREFGVILTNSLILKELLEENGTLLSRFGSER